MTATRSLSASLQHLNRSLSADELARVPDAELVGRFVERRDESAFTAIVRRYGALVLGVCRRVLRHEQDAEDAFQATFLVFARDAAAVRRAGAIGNWLYGVAHNVARKARATRSRRERKERAAAQHRRPDTPPAAADDLAEILDAELTALPGKYRAALVLCDLLGRTIQDAAAEVGCPPKTLGTRLQRGRALLANRLARRGVAGSVGALMAALVPGPTATASVPPCLLDSTVRSAVDFATGSAVASPAVAALTYGVSNVMTYSALKLVVLAGGVLVAGVVATAPVLHAVRAAHAPRTARSATAAAPAARTEPQPAPPAPLESLHRFFMSLLPWHNEESTTAAEDKKDDTPKPLTGVWMKKEGELKIEFVNKTALKISPHGKDDQILILCEYTPEKDGVVKAKVTGFEGKEEAKKAISAILPVGTAFTFKWKVNKGVATLDEVKGEKADTLKSHLEGEFSEKK